MDFGDTNIQSIAARVQLSVFAHVNSFRPDNNTTSKHQLYLHFINEETEAQRGYHLPRGHAASVRDGMSPGSPDSELGLISKAGTKMIE